MSTHAAIFIPTTDGETYELIYCHYDGYPANMMPALATHDPSLILAAGELSFISADEIGSAMSPRRPTRTRSTRLPHWADHGYVLDGNGWRTFSRRR